MDLIKLEFVLNGETVNANVFPATRLVDCLRDTFELTGTKTGCGEGECGACTVIVDGVAVNACLYLAADADGKDVLTIEGLKGNGALHRIAQAFVENGAVQCGFCTPGMILRAYAFLKENTNPSEEDIRRSVEGNICRCTGYVKILEAIKSLAGPG